MFRNVPKQQTRICADFANWGLDFGREKVVTVPETFTANLKHAPLIARRWARKDSRCDAASVPLARVAVAAPLASPHWRRSSPAAAAAPGDRRRPRSRPQVPRHDGLGRSRLHQELQPVHRRRPAERQFVQGAFYEPLIVTGEGGLKPVPWLARSWKWSNGNKTLTLNLAKGAKWSDGKPLTSADVVYSLTAGRQDKTMDRIGLVGAGNEIASVKAKGAHKRRDHAEDPGLAVHLCHPEPAVRRPEAHLVEGRPTRRRSRTRSRSARARSTASRASRRRTTSSTRTRTTGSAGLPKIACLEYVQAASNDAALALIQSGQVDWTHNFVPNVEKAYGAKDPKHYHAFYATTAYPLSLVFDDTQYPYSLVAFRKALSLAIDRKTVWKLGEYGYAPPTDAIGLSGLFPKWVTDPAVKKLAKQMATYNPTGAKKLLTDAGFTYKGSRLIDPKGDRVKLDIHVISGWSDWVASNQIITKNLRDIGIDSKVRLEPSWGDWFPNAFSTKNPTLLWQVGSRGSPYGFFYANLSKNAFIPSGQDATARPATGSTTPTRRRRVCSTSGRRRSTRRSSSRSRRSSRRSGWRTCRSSRCSSVPRWSTYSTKYFHCFSSPKNFYGDPIFTTFPDNILSFTRICPGGKSGP